MKISKQRLNQIIKEELAKVKETLDSTFMSSFGSDTDVEEKPVYDPAADVYEETKAELMAMVKAFKYASSYNNEPERLRAFAKALKDAAQSIEDSVVNPL